MRVLSYDVGDGEGFNLRRDALVRAVLLVRLLGPDWTLVLPPFPRMVHWREDDEARSYLPWSTFFEVDSLRAVVDAIEFDDWAKSPLVTVDRAIRLIPDRAGFELPWRVGTVDCPPAEPEVAPTDDTSLKAYRGAVRFRPERVDCLSWFAPYTSLGPILRDGPGDSVFVSPLEVAFWDGTYGDEEYWRVRSHIVFAERLRRAAGDFIERAFGAEPFVALHLRRGDDFANRDLPSTDEVCDIVRAVMERSGCDRVFLATDTSEEERAVLTERTGCAYFAPPSEEWRAGEVAIIDQCVCTRASWFVGTPGSTFSIVVREEREILGQPSESSWNELCRPTRGADGSIEYELARPVNWPFVGKR